MTMTILSLIGLYSAMYGIDPKVALAVAKVESNLNVNAVGSKGEIGLFQIMPSTYPKVSKQDLFNPEINIKLGIQHLAWNKKYCKYRENNLFLTCYNYGIKNTEKIKYPQLWPYYKKVMAEVKKSKTHEVMYAESR